MADEYGVYGSLLVEGLLEGKDDEHAVDALLDPAETAVLPGPELGADEPEDGNAGAAKVFGKTEVYVGEVDEDGCVGPLLADAADETAVAGVDPGDVTEDFRHAHDGDVFGSDGALLAGGFHGGSTEAGEGGCREVLAQGGDELCAVGVSGGFAGGKEDARMDGLGDGLVYRCRS